MTTLQPCFYVQHCDSESILNYFRSGHSSIRDTVTYWQAKKLSITLTNNEKTGRHFIVSIFFFAVFLRTITKNGKIMADPVVVLTKEILVLDRIFVLFENSTFVFMDNIYGVGRSLVSSETGNFWEVFGTLPPKSLRRVCSPPANAVLPRCWPHKLGVTWLIPPDTELQK